MNSNTDGLILFRKQPGITSFDALRDIKRILGTGKVGHTGTLDKFAEGLLLILTGRALKLSQWFTHCDKQYEGTICFGAETDTLDPEGEVIANAPLPSRESVQQAIVQFLGKIEQVPPAYSAIHIDGERASALARRGNAPEMQKRPVTIYRLKLLSWEPPYARIFVHCSSGTYIRSLARDIALAAGSRGYLSGLLRTQVGGFNLQEAVSGEQWGLGTGDWGLGGVVSKQSEFTNTQSQQTKTPTPEPQPSPKGEGSPLDPRPPIPLLPINKDVFDKLGIPCLEIIPAHAIKIKHGKPLAQIIKDVPVENAAVAIFSDNKFIAMIERQNNKWSYGYVYARD